MGEMAINYKEEYYKWLSDSNFDAGTKEELRSIENEKEIEDRFYKRLDFGTGGLRGIIGAGTNRMNIYTVGQATQGLSNYINNQTGNKGSVAIAYDSRHMSKEFALEAALILCANGIKTYLYKTLHSTPQLSFAVRYLQTTAGIVITASHNPPQYNGYKVYWSDGAQIVSPHDKGIIAEVNKIDNYSKVKKISEEKAVKLGLLNYIGEEVDSVYLKELLKLSLNPDVIKEEAGNIRIVYTPLNGTGHVPVLALLKEMGFVNVWEVEEQAKPDGDFPTLKYPNPEDEAAFDYAIKKAKEVNADIVLATDPDADRLGVYAYDVESRQYVKFNGNMSGLLIAEYILSQKAQKGLLPENKKDAALVTTIVSSNMGKAIANYYGISIKEVLTGFKYIGEQMSLFEQAVKDNAGKLDNKKNALEFEFGYEESYGCLIGTHARDKDAIVAVMFLCEAAAFYKKQGLTLVDQINNMYKKYGYYSEGLTSIVLSGIEGAERIKQIMEKLKRTVPIEIGEKIVISYKDFLKGEKKDLQTSKIEPINLPKSNVLYFELENDAWCCVRPSGTEPKIKIYYGAKGTTQEDAQEGLKRIKEDIEKQILE